VDALTLGIASAVFEVNLVKPEELSYLFIRKKPFNAKVLVEKAKYWVNYLYQNDKWYLNASRVEMDVKVDWKRRLFHTRYAAVMEMAVTDWKRGVDERWLQQVKVLKPSAIVVDQPIGFADPEFWGRDNVIEPDKSIESAIHKISKQLHLEEK
jgi:hypothetical protein